MRTFEIIDKYNSTLEVLFEENEGWAKINDNYLELTVKLNKNSLNDLFVELFDHLSRTEKDRKEMIQWLKDAYNTLTLYEECAKIVEGDGYVK